MQQHIEILRTGQIFLYKKKPIQRTERQCKSHEENERRGNARPTTNPEIFN